jgi:hypothetical protein
MLDGRPVYLHLAAFHRARGGVNAPEVAFGERWRVQSHEPRYRLVYVTATGDVFARPIAAHGRRTTGPIIVVATVPPGSDRGGAHPPWDRVAVALDGWQDVCGEWGSLRWALDRLAAYPPRRTAPIIRRAKSPLVP